MASKDSDLPGEAGLCRASMVELLGVCLSDAERAASWSELAGRILPRLRKFIRGTLCSVAKRPANSLSVLPGGLQEADLLQNVLVRLLENDRLLLRRFTGHTEEDLLNYLAIISRSTVLDNIRRQLATKRATGQFLQRKRPRFEGFDPGSEQASGRASADLTILAREITEIAKAVLAGSSVRDKVIFQLHYFENLSTEQIAKCQGIALSHSGVKRVLRQLKNRIRIMAESSAGRELTGSGRARRIR